MEAEDVKRDLQKFYSVENTKIFVMPYTAIPKKEWFSLDDVKIDKYHLPDQYFLFKSVLGAQGSWDGFCGFEAAT